MSISAEDLLPRSDGRANDPNPEVPERAKRRPYTARCNLEVLAEYETLDRDAKGSLLRREVLRPTAAPGRVRRRVLDLRPYEEHRRRRDVAVGSKNAARKTGR